MEQFRTDVLIIGAGPAGSSAALWACRNGVDALMVEQRKKVGVPVQCAEFIPAMLLKDLDQERAFIVQKIKGMRTYINGKMEKEIQTPGLMIKRDLFDQALAESAKKSGAILFTGTKAVALSDQRSVLLKREGKHDLEVHAKVIVAADGPLSQVRTWVNAPRQNPLPAVQMSFSLPSASDFTEVFFDRTIHAGYAWLFPKGDIANVGVGFRKNNRFPQSPGKLLGQFVSQLKDQGKILGESLSHRAGWIPAEPIRKAVYGNILFVGDAAGQTHPITGAGIFSAVTCGTMAGEVAARAIRKNDFSQLMDYDHEWQEMFERTQTHAHLCRRKMETQWDNFDQIIKSCWVAFGAYHAG